MGALSLVCAILGVAAVAFPIYGKFVAVGLGIFAAASGALAYRRRGAPPKVRLAGAAGLALGLLAFLLGAAKVVLTLLALHRLERMLGP